MRRKRIIELPALQAAVEVEPEVGIAVWTDPGPPVCGAGARRPSRRFLALENPGLYRVDLVDLMEAVLQDATGVLRDAAVGEGVKPRAELDSPYSLVIRVLKGGS